MALLNILLSNPPLLTFIAALLSVALGFFSLLRSRKLDKRAEVSGAASFQLGALGEIIDGLNAHIDALIKDNQGLRQNVAQLAGDRIATAMERMATATEEMASKEREQEDDKRKPKGRTPLR